MAYKAAREIWEAALGELQVDLQRHNYNTYLKNTVGLDFQENTFLVGTSTPFAAEWLSERLRTRVEKVLLNITKRSWDIQFKVFHQATSDRESPGPLLGKDSQQGDNHNPQKPSWSTLNGSGTRCRLNPRYTFETFIVGSSNRLAHAAAFGVVENLQDSYNPLFIFANVGLGKTHLLHAIGNMAQSRHLQVLYVSTEQFTNDFISALQGKKSEQFRSKYRSVDILLMDDIHFLSGKEQTQEVFFHTFNHLHAADKHIVMTSDRHPKAMDLLEDRLVSRFQGGLTVDIQPPDIETRLAILKDKAVYRGIELTDEIYEFLASKVQENIRELEGVFNTVIALAKVQNRPISLEMAKNIIAQYPSISKRKPTPEQIIDAVAQYYSLPPDALKGKKRDREITQPRHIAIYLMREETDAALKEIGKAFGHRDHSTILYAYDKISSLIDSDINSKNAILQIRETLYKITSKTA